MSSETRRMLRATAVAVIAAVMSVPSVAGATDFTPLPGAPGVGTLTGPGAIQPGGATPTTYTVSTTISSSATLDYLSSVTLCLYKSGEEDRCDDANPDPTKAFVVTWTEPASNPAAEVESDSDGGEFAEVGTNEYVLDTTCGGDASCNKFSWTGDYATATSMDIKFAFTVSKAMLKSDADGWTALVTALDDRTDAATAGGKGTKSGTFAVSYYGEINTSADNTTNFGNLAESSNATANNIDGVKYRANAASKYQIAATDFDYGSGTSTLDLVAPSDPDSPGTPASAKVFLSCKIGATWSATDDTWVTNSAADMVGSVSASTDENDSTRNNFSCKLYYGSGATRTLVAHSSTITISIADAA